MSLVLIDTCPDCSSRRPSYRGTFKMKLRRRRSDPHGHALQCFTDIAKEPRRNRIEYAVKAAPKALNFSDSGENRTYFCPRNVTIGNALPAKRLELRVPLFHEKGH